MEVEIRIALEARYVSFAPSHLARTNLAARLVARETRPGEGTSSTCMVFQVIGMGKGSG